MCKETRDKKQGHVTLQMSTTERSPGSGVGEEVFTTYGEEEVAALAPSLNETGVHFFKLATADGSTESFSGTSENYASAADKSENGLEPALTENREVGTLTEVCYHDDIDEVNLVSLIEEQIPRYVLRADTLTDFAGYDNADWIQTPCLPDDTDLDLSPILVEETLKYFTLCGDRVSQMTKTYNDIEAVTRLLEEKERDLELAARIGQSLLEKNKDLEQKNETLEDQLTQATDRISQLRHEITQKDALVQLYNREGEGEDSNVTSPSLDPASSLARSAALSDQLHKRLQTLEAENISLKLEQAELESETSNLEEKEAYLMNDCLGQLSKANNEKRDLQDELLAKNDVNQRLQEEITSLKSKVIAYENKSKRLLIENAELQKHLSAAIEVQRELTAEIAAREDKYQEVIGLHLEAQDEIKALRKKHKPTVIRQHAGNYNPFGSLAAELDDSMRKSGPGYTERKNHSRRVMETARFVRHSSRANSRTGSRAGSRAPTRPGSCTSGNDSCDSICGSSVREDPSSGDESEAILGELDSMHGSASSSMVGRPGIPGSNDLETALRRLSTRKANEINERMFEDTERKKLNRRRGSDDSDTPNRCRTPESYLSTGSGSNLSDFSRMSGISSYKMPEKLQIIKPLEGSQTLHHWQRLATPHLGGLFDDRDGIAIKGERKYVTGEEEELMTLSDYEEDEEFEYIAKSVDMTSSTYTYTTAKVMHPSDNYLNTTTTDIYDVCRTPLSGPLPGSDAPATSGAEQTTPRPDGSGDAGNAAIPMSCRGATATTTFSMSMGLATQLGERGIGPHDVQPAPGVCPQRFTNLVTEVERPTGDKNSATDTIYTNSSLYMPPIEGLGASCGPMRFQPENAYLNLVDKVKDIGLNSILNIVSSSGLKPVQLDPIDVGLNTIMGIKRNRGLANQVAGQPALTNQAPGRRSRVSTSHRRGGAQTFTTSTNLGPVTSVITHTSHTLPGQQKGATLSERGFTVGGGVGQPYIPPEAPASATSTPRPSRPTSLHLTNTNTTPMMSTQPSSKINNIHGNVDPHPNVNNPRGDGPNNNVTSTASVTLTSSSGAMTSALMNKLGLGGVAAGLTSSKAKS